MRGVKGRRRGPVYGEKVPDVTTFEKVIHQPRSQVTAPSWRPVHYRRPGALSGLCGVGKIVPAPSEGKTTYVTCQVCLRKAFPAIRKAVPVQSGVKQEDLYELADKIGGPLDAVRDRFRQVHAMCLLERGYMSKAELKQLELLCAQLYNAADDLGTAANELWGEVQWLNVETPRRRGMSHG